MRSGLCDRHCGFASKRVRGPQPISGAGGLPFAILINGTVFILGQLQHWVGPTSPAHCDRCQIGNEPHMEISSAVN